MLPLLGLVRTEDGRRADPVLADEIQVPCMRKSAAEGRRACAGATR